MGTVLLMANYMERHVDGRNITPTGYPTPTAPRGVPERYECACVYRNHVAFIIGRNETRYVCRVEVPDPFFWDSGAVDADWVKELRRMMGTVQARDI
jgi:hypothetical protein